MAPDKIYIEQKAVMYDLVNTEPCKPDDYEYIRKDALLEWAKEKFSDLTKKFEAQDDPVWWGQRNAFQQMIDKLNSL